LGWSATAEKSTFVFEDANDVFGINDEEMQKRLLDTNPNAFRDMVTTFWRPTDVDTGKQVKKTLPVYKSFLLSVEDRIEGE
jgi:magnesium chelatase subunit H